jgi:uncharacterized membrane protein
MTDWIKAMNPSSPINTESDAVAAARASAIAIFLGVAWGLVGVVQGFMSQEQMTEAAAAAAAASDPAAAGMAGPMVQGILYFTVAVVVIQAVLGLVQWTKPNVVIPIIFAILVVGGAVLALLGLMNAPANAPAAPLWQTVVGFIVLAVQLVLHVAGIRGARQLDKIRMDAAQAY